MVGFGSARASSSSIVTSWSEFSKRKTVFFAMQHHIAKRLETNRPQKWCEVLICCGLASSSAGDGLFSGGHQKSRGQASRAEDDRSRPWNGTYVFRRRGSWVETSDFFGLDPKKVPSQRPKKPKKSGGEILDFRFWILD